MILAAALTPKTNFELAILDNADHSFAGREEEVADVILEWSAAI